MKTDLCNNQKPLIRRVHKHGNYLSIGLPEIIKTQMAISSDDYLSIFYDSTNQAIIYKKVKIKGENEG